MSRCWIFAYVSSPTHLLAQVINLCEKEGLSINGSDYDMRSALHLASGEGRLAVVVYLLAAGANPNAEDRWGGRPLDDALRHSHAEVEKALRSAGGEEGGGATAGSNTGVSRAASYISSGTGKGRQVGGPGEEFLLENLSVSMDDLAPGDARSNSSPGPGPGPGPRPRPRPCLAPSPGPSPTLTLPQP